MFENFKACQEFKVQSLISRTPLAICKSMWRGACVRTRALCQCAEKEQRHRSCRYDNEAFMSMQIEIKLQRMTEPLASS